MLALIMNSVPVSFGAVGTPTWFGFSGLGLSEHDLLEIGRTSALLHTVAAVFIPVIALSFVVSWKSILRNIIFI
ncbi:L-lactate permease, partial [Escherichia coli]|nr:L-lactate permease [Escherichia coli]